MLVTPNRTVLTMSAIRIISATIEFGAALLLLHYNRVDTALRINSLLGMVGPTVFISVSLLGVTALAGSIPTAKLVLIISGIVLVLLGTTR